MESLTEKLMKVKRTGKRNLKGEYKKGFSKIFKECVIPLRRVGMNETFIVNLFWGYEKEWEFKQVMESLHNKRIVLETIDQHPLMSYDEVVEKREINKNLYNSPTGVIHDFEAFVIRGDKRYTRGFIWFEHTTAPRENDIWVKDVTFDAVREHQSKLEDLLEPGHVFIKGYSNNNEEPIQSAVAYYMDTVRDYYIQKNRIVISQQDIESDVLFYRKKDKYYLENCLESILLKTMR